MTRQSKIKTMKRTLLFLLLFTGMVNAQNVIFTDPNFKQALLTTAYVENVDGFYITLDANNDSEIQYSEAMDVGRIEVNNSNISSLDGIEAFFNLKHLQCNDNNLTIINLQNFTELTDLSCSNNQIANLLLSGCNNLTNLFCSNNQLTFLDMSSFPLLYNFECQNNSISVLATINCPNLTYFNFTNNPLLIVDTSNCTSLVSLSFTNFNSLNSLTVSGCTGLTYFGLNSSQVNTLSLQNLTSLNNVIINYNANLNNLTITNCPNITNFDCANNNISSLNLTSLTNITQLRCGYNPISSLNVSTLTNLTNLFCNDSQITTLDVSNLTNLTYLWIPNNSQLQTVFAKNGLNEAFTLDNNPNLDFICADDSQVATIQGQLNTAGMTSTVVNSYCSFVPGGNYNTITGTIRYDANNNGCDASDSTQPLIRININDGINQGATFTNANGSYNFYTLAGSFTINPSVENPTFFTITPSNATIPFANTNNNTATQNFCIAPNGVHPDLEIVVAPITPARPGFNATYRVAYKNKGNQTLSGTATLNYNDAVMDFVSATAAPSSQSTGVLNWNYTNLLPFESRNYFVTLNINSPTETPPVNINDVLIYTASITPVASDAIPADNSFTLNQTVVSSFDPNEIRCLQGAVVPVTEIGKYLHYVVNFENTGNFVAENVVVKVDIDPTKYDISTLQMLNTSHPSYTKITGNKVEFIFENINLSATSGNPPVGGHGNVLFKIKSKSTLVSGNTVAKQANIYFDYNAPVNTNITQTTFGALNNTIHQFDTSVKIYPNPTHSLININSDFVINSVELYDIQGRILETSLESSSTTTLDISNRETGIYFLKINTENGSKVEKIVKE